MTKKLNQPTSTEHREILDDLINEAIDELEAKLQGLGIGDETSSFIDALRKSSSTEDRRDKLDTLEARILPRLNIQDVDKQAIKSLIMKVKATDSDPYLLEE